MNLYSNVLRTAWTKWKKITKKKRNREYCVWGTKTESVCCLKVNHGIQWERKKEIIASSECDTHFGCLFTAMRSNVCVYPFIHYPMCSIKISYNLLNFPLVRTSHNGHVAYREIWREFATIVPSLACWLALWFFGVHPVEISLCRHNNAIQK